MQGSSTGGVKGGNVGVDDDITDERRDAEEGDADENVLDCNDATAGAALDGDDGVASDIVLSASLWLLSQSGTPLPDM